MSCIRFVRATVPLALIVGSLAVAPVASAHTHIHVGEYELTIGWGNEPTYVGVPNVVELSIADADGQPVTDLGPGDITVVVSTSDQSTAALPLQEQFGTPGRYGADLLPTVAGDYTFAFAGTLREETVDVSVASGEDTFSPVQSSTEVEFPVKVPTLADVATGLDRINGRIEELQASAIDPQALANLQNTVADARAAADRASLMGIIVGGTGLVVAAVALFVAWRGTHKGAGSA